VSKHVLFFVRTNTSFKWRCSDHFNSDLFGSYISYSGYINWLALFLHNEFLSFPLHWKWHFSLSSSYRSQFDSPGTTTTMQGERRRDWDLLVEKADKSSSCNNFCMAVVDCFAFHAKLVPCYTTIACATKWTLTVIHSSSRWAEKKNSCSTHEDGDRLTRGNAHNDPFVLFAALRPFRPGHDEAGDNFPSDNRVR